MKRLLSTECESSKWNELPKWFAYASVAARAIAAQPARNRVPIAPEDRRAPTGSRFLCRPGRGRLARPAELRSDAQEDVEIVRLAQQRRRAPMSGASGIAGHQH